MQPTCKPTDFVCENKECIIAEWRCDIDFDCTDGSDEVGCDGKISYMLFLIYKNTVVDFCETSLISMNNIHLV